MRSPIPLVVSVLRADADQFDVNPILTTHRTFVLRIWVCKTVCHTRKGLRACPDQAMEGLEGSN